MTSDQFNRKEIRDQNQQLTPACVSTLDLVTI